MKLACSVELPNREPLCGYLIQIVHSGYSIGTYSGLQAVVVDFKGRLHFVKPGNVTVLKSEVSL